MKRRDYLFQYAAALLFFWILSVWIRVPGYMDAEYYTLSAVQLTSGKGLTQPILWNYLDDPKAIPHPSHTYWMPAPSIVASAGMLFTGKSDFASGRIPFIFLAALAAPMAGWMGYRFSRKQIIAWLAAGLAIFCGYYAPYSSTTDSFFLIMPGAWLLFFCFDRMLPIGEKSPSIYWLLLGLAAGWIHLNRADGFLWLGLAGGFWMYQIFKNPGSYKTLKPWGSLLLLTASYLAVTGFWYYRNIAEFGSLFVPHSSRALWVTRYDELFTFPPEMLTFQHWAASGFATILMDRLGALARNLVTMAAVQGLVFLFPLWFVAGWKRRNDPLVRIAFGMELVILLIMSFIFPYSGGRGGFLHSSAALQPFLWGLSAAGIMDGLNWISARAKWDPDRAVRMFVPGILLISCIITVFVFNMLVIGENPDHPAWDESSRRSNLAAELEEANHVSPSARTMINNPAGFGLASGRETLVIPFGTPETTLAIAEKFHVEYLLLEKNLVSGLFRLYQHPDEFPEFTLIDKREDLLLFRINPVTGGVQ